jgi:hypothetical protein
MTVTVRDVGDLLRPGQSVSAHDLARCGEVGRASGCGVEDGCHFVEVVGAEHAGGDDRERSRVHVAGVVELKVAYVR